MTYQYDRQESQNRSVNDQITALKMQDINEELDFLFKRMDDRNLTLTRTVQGDVIQIVDNINSITIDIDYTDFNAVVPKLYIQESGDINRFTITYVGLYPSTIVYGP